MTAAQEPEPAPPAKESLKPLPAELRPAAPAVDQPVTPDNPELSSKTAEPDLDWAPTENPNATLVPGQMRSDREEIPAPFTKEDADKAEMMEAQERSTLSRMSIAAVTCQTYWPSPFQVCGAIRDKYNALGGPASFLTFPSSGNIINPDGVGERVTFLNGPIYWHPDTGAHPVVNSFLNRWGIHQYEAGWLKYPTTDEIVLPDGGRRQEFQHGAIYVAFQNAVGSAIRNGPLRDKYNSVGGLAPGGTLLGYPIQDQVPLPDGQGQMDRFEHGVIYWHPSTGAHEVYGHILATWETAGYEGGPFGYPTSSPTSNGPSSYIQQFQNGSLTQVPPGPTQVWVSVSGQASGGSIGGRFCQSGVFGWSDFPSLRETLDHTWNYPRNNHIWQVPDDDEVWKVWCHVTNGEAYIIQPDWEDAQVRPSPKYDLSDGTVCFFRTSSRSGGYTIDFNVPGYTKNWKVHVA
ncbi:LGFP repeat-containing protein [Rhodococcus ruber]